MSTLNNDKDIFNKLKKQLLMLDPVAFVETYLTLDGKPFRIRGNGYKPFADIYRYIGIKALEPNSKPVIMVKGRQVGATTMASALEMYFMGSGIFGAGDKPPIRIIHTFPQLELAAAYSKTKLNQIINSSIALEVENEKKNSKPKTYMQSLLDQSSSTNDSLHFKQFVNGNHLWVESTGLDADRIMGRQLCLQTELPTPHGFIKLQDLKEGDQLFDENGQICQVTKLHPINLSPEAYRITFNDGSAIDACADHLWLTYTNKERKSNTPSVKNTKALFLSIKHKHSIPCTQAINYPEQELLDPYLVGIELQRSIHSIPEQYLRGSISQRVALLQGILNDYNCNKNKVTLNLPKLLGKQVYQLVTSLGIKAKLELYFRSRVTFSTDSFVFNRQPSIKNSHRFIVSIDRIESKPMRCITVDSPSHLFLVTKSFIPTHNTADVMFFDEVQKTTDQAIGNALKILTTAKYGNKGVQVFFGTPRRKGSGFYKRWVTSTQQYYYLGCAKCNEFFPLYTPGSDDWEKIWLHGFIVKCAHCGHEQDKRVAAENGKWIPLKSESDEDCKMIGFHINQLYMPLFTKEDILNEKPGIHPVNTERVYQNEVLGEFFQGDSSPITPEEIRDACADQGRKFRARISPGEEEFIVLGVDYGARADLEQLANPEKAKGVGQSYSTAVVMVAKGPGLLSIEFATKFKRNDFESKKGIIDQLMRQYSIQLAIGDIGYSNDFSEVLHNTYGDRYLVSRAHSRVNNYVKYNQEAYPKEIVFERDHYIGELYEQMKKGMIKFPFGDYEKVAWLIEHCASMEIKPSISRGGDPTVHYVKGNTPNDGFMALLNAYIAYKFLITKGFVNVNSDYKNKSFSELNKPLITSGYISRKF